MRDASLPALTAPLLAQLTAMHAEPHRRYHTLAHVDALRAWLKTYDALATEPAWIEAAIWFHDAVYDTRRSDNEARSAALAQRELQALGWPEAPVAAVAAMVQATQLHDAPDTARDTLLFLDLDLSVLGQSTAHYAAYVDAIRFEYAWVDAARYRAGRMRVLQAFIAREFIYRTPTLRAAWETNARRNLQHELDALASAPA